MSAQARRFSWRRQDSGESHEARAARPALISPAAARCRRPCPPPIGLGGVRGPPPLHSHWGHKVWPRDSELLLVPPSPSLGISRGAHALALSPGISLAPEEELSLDL